MTSHRNDSERYVLQDTFELDSSNEPPRSASKPPAESTKGSAVNLRKSSDMGPTISWTPFFLRRTTLSVFLVVFLSLVIALAVLYNYSQLHDGVGTADNRDHYLWTYGPTAG